MNAPVRPYTIYTQAEKDSIAAWLKEGGTATQIAAKLSVLRGERLTRNAIIGVVHRDKTLKEIGFDRGNQMRAGKRKDGSIKIKLPKAPAARRSNAPSPYHLPGRLFIAELNGETQGDEAYSFLSPAIRTPGPVAQPHFVAMRFLDCLFNRCRAPISSDLEERPGPDMLCCGFHSEPGKPYCTYHKKRLCDREHNYRAEAA